MTTTLASCALVVAMVATIAAQNPAPGIPQPPNNRRVLTNQLGPNVPRLTNTPPVWATNRGGRFTNYPPGFTNYPPGFTNRQPGFTNHMPGFTNFAPGLTNSPGTTNYPFGTTNYPPGFTNRQGGLNRWATNRFGTNLVQPIPPNQWPPGSIKPVPHDPNNPGQTVQPGQRFPAPIRRVPHPAPTPRPAPAPVK